MLDRVTSLRLLRSTLHCKTNNAKFFRLLYFKMRRGYILGILEPPNLSQDVNKEISGLKKGSESAPWAWIVKTIYNLVSHCLHSISNFDRWVRADELNILLGIKYFNAPSFVNTFGSKHNKLSLLKSLTWRTFFGPFKKML